MRLNAFLTSLVCLGMAGPLLKNSAPLKNSWLRACLIEFYTKNFLTIVELSYLEKTHPLCCSLILLEDFILVWPTTDIWFIFSLDVLLTWFLKTE